MLYLKTLILKTAIDSEMTRVRASMRREARDTAPEGFKPVFDKKSIPLDLVFVDDQIAVPIDLRRLRNITIRSLRHNKDVIGCKNCLVAGYVEG